MNTVRKAKGELRRNVIDPVRMRGLRSELEKQKKIIAKARDRMRELMNEYDEIWRCASEAHDDIDRVIDRLSEYL